MREKEINLENVEASHTLGGTVEGGTKGEGSGGVEIFVVYKMEDSVTKSLKH